MLNNNLRLIAILALLLILVVVLIIATAIGSVTIPASEVLAAIGHGLSDSLSGVNDTIIWKIRLPRALLAALVGSLLSISGAAYQGVFRNPLADPYLLGVASGASFGAAFAIAFLSQIPIIGIAGVPLISFLFSLLAVLLVVIFAYSNGKIPIINLILAGVVVGSSFTAATSFIMISNKDRAVNILAWLLGSFSLSGWSKLFSVLPFHLIVFVLLLLSARALNLLQLGEEQAMQLGLPVNRFKAVIIVLATLATAAAVSVSGIIGFVGLMVPHAARLAFGPDHRLLVPVSAILGAIFLVLADLLARTIISPEEIPIGVVTALVGGPFFLFLLKRAKL